jgi:hypothetical protein
MRVTEIENPSRDIYKVLFSTADLAKELGVPHFQVRYAVDYGIIPVTVIGKDRTDRGKNGWCGIDFDAQSDVLISAAALTKEYGIALWRAIRVIRDQNSETENVLTIND